VQTFKQTVDFSALCILDLGRVQEHLGFLQEHFELFSVFIGGDIRHA
jgi:hypothetical protein